MRLMKFPNGKMALEFNPPEFPLLLMVLKSFIPHDQEGKGHLDEAKMMVQAEIAGNKGNDTIN